MQTSCVRSGQVEIGIIAHEGKEYAAIGASVVGRSLTAYTKSTHGEIHLTSWCGQTILACRSEVVERYADGSMAIMFRLSGNQFIVGYAFADDGMLFRGELLRNGDEDDARYLARQLADDFAQLDADDEEAFARALSRNIPSLIPRLLLPPRLSCASGGKACNFGKTPWVNSESNTT
jgi:hypothetical protein